MLRVLLESGVNDSSFDMQARNAHGWTALHTAAYLNRSDALRVMFLFTAGSEVLAALTEFGHTALHLACSRGNTEVIRMLIKHIFTSPLNANKK
jgi:ankyrin repeat protein